MTRREALVRVIEALHAEIDALKTNDLQALQTATATKLAGLETVALYDGEAPCADVKALAAEAHRLNETCRIYVNLMAANVRRRLQLLSGNALPAYRPGGYAMA